MSANVAKAAIGSKKHSLGAEEHRIPGCLFEFRVGETALHVVMDRLEHPSRYRGRIVFLNFWATWCVPCRQEMPAMERLHRDYRERGLIVVAVNFKETTSAVRGFMQELRLSFPATLDLDGAVSKSFGVRGLPVTFLLDREGKILWKAIGSREWDGPHGRAYLDHLLRPPGKI